MHTERVRQQELEWEGGEQGGGVTNANVVATFLCLCSSTFCGSLVQICIVHFVFFVQSHYFASVTYHSKENNDSRLRG